MTHKATDVRTYSFRKEDRLFLDANIWFSIYGPLSYHDWRTDVYSKALRQVLSSKSLILIDATVLSEFVNRFARYEYDRLDENTKPATFKEFRQSAEFNDVAAEIVINVKNILKNAMRCNFNFDSININKLLTDFQSGAKDFNDSLIIELCDAEDLILITHDADFRNCKVAVLTANNKLLYA